MTTLIKQADRYKKVFFFIVLIVIGFTGLIASFFLQLNFIQNILLDVISQIKNTPVDAPGTAGLPNSYYWKLNLSFFVETISKLSLILIFLSTVMIFFIDLFSDSLLTIRHLMKKIMTNKNIFILIYYIIIVSLILVSLFIRFSHFQLPSYNPDGYIEPAVNFFENGFFRHMKGRSFIYPGFLFIILLMFKNFSFISIIQHFLGIIAGLILLYSWNKTIVFISNKNLKLLHRFLSLLLLSFYLFNTFYLKMENSMMRESIFALIYSLNIMFFIKFILKIKNNQSPYFQGFMTILLSYFTFIYQPSWGFNIFVSLFAVIITFIVFNKKKKNDYYKNIIYYFIIMPLFFAFVFFYTPEKIMGSIDTKTKTFGSGTFFFTHLNVIEEEIVRDIMDPEFKKYDKKLLKMILDMKEKHTVKTGNFSKIGYDFNKLFWGETSHNVNLYFNNNVRDIKSFYDYYFKKSIMKHPFKYLNKIFIEISDYYINRKIAYNRSFDFQSSWDYSARWDYIIDRRDSSFGGMRNYVENIIKMSEIKPTNNSYSFKKINYFYRIFDFLFFPVLIIFAGLFIYMSIKFKSVDKNISFFMFLTLFAISLNFFTVLTVSVSYIFITRYGDVLFVTQLIFLFSAIISITNFGIDIFIKFKKNRGQLHN